MRLPKQWLWHVTHNHRYILLLCVYKRIAAQSLLLPLEQWEQSPFQAAVTTGAFLGSVWCIAIIWSEVEYKTRSCTRPYCAQSWDKSIVGWVQKDNLKNTWKREGNAGNLGLHRNALVSFVSLESCRQWSEWRQEHQQWQATAFHQCAMKTKGRVLSLPGKGGSQMWTATKTSLEIHVRSFNKTTSCKDKNMPGERSLVFDWPVK